jgi:DNA primase
MSHQWINFTELRKQLSFAAVLSAYNVHLEPKGNSDQHVGKCPLPSHHDAKGNTFSANFAKGVWQCFGCHESGNVIDFAVLMERKNKKDGQAVRAVAMQLKERFVEKRPGTSAPTTQKREAAKPVVVNQPLDFALKTLEALHPYFDERKLLPETVARFGLGFCKRGSLSGRIAIPLEDDAGQLIGYAGLDPEGKSGVPRYAFPIPREHEGKTYAFDPGRFLYNGHRLARAVKDLIVVRECHTVWHLFQGGFANVVALMTDRSSEEQGALIPLLTSESARIWFLTDSSHESYDTAAHFLPFAAANRLCRWIKVQTEEEMVPDHPLLRALKR